ncbi:regulatory helix-turn-helix protein, lysR family [Meinhardsimonia xiamenensis]|jgi:DNA-binding transcriptional LysR family regulator|uniref:Regulatory helix-turn-helix protein, lysR family n=1 Tax=Meinhardsimonia xiamenensis TaxID=990712 RepID=A0A1G9AYU0_9RHOB|nr:LysR family transcriptional regulator [Meinhardsimonia xiamenensis]PRX35194.1 regulatory helix-turn-helix LysR family protein [Meinhardsimonia xiamenensis]SDK32437.1 regulatory helix-turn-helix protein, lysR family [Meinhardsimonia xiamenensis]
MPTPPKTPNLRHLRAFLAIAETGSLTRAAARVHVSQPAVSQALAGFERQAGGPLFDRTGQGVFLTERGRVLEARVRRALNRLDAALAAVSPRLPLTATTARLMALIATAEAQNFTLAARRLGVAQPTVHRAIAQFEAEAGKRLFERTSHGVVPTRACRELAEAARLAFAELAQADAELAELDGGDGGAIVIGALPLSRSVVLPEALARFRAARPRHPVTVLDGRYGDLLTGLRRGEIDFILGALRDPPPIGDIVQEALFADRLAVLARPGHSLAGRSCVPLETLARQAWVVPRTGTPARAQFDELFTRAGLVPPESILECGSILLMRELLGRSDMLGCISARQAEAEVARGLLVPLDIGRDWPERPIGLTFRAEWVPTRAQSQLIGFIRKAADRARG